MIVYVEIRWADNATTVHLTDPSDGHVWIDRQGMIVAYRLILIDEDDEVAPVEGAWVRMGA